jgi:ATP-dependent helicase/nuclease subunit B
VSIRFIYGRAGSGKSRACLNQICERRLRNPDVNYMLIVPEQFSFQSEMELLSIGGEKIAADVLVCSFKRLSFWVKNKYGIVNEKQVNKAGKNLILTDILFQEKDRLMLYGGLEDPVSFINRLSSLISEFKRYGVREEKLKECLNSMDKNTSIYGKVHDLALLYGAYQKAIEDLTDPDDSLYWLAQTIREDRLFTDYEIWIDGFDGFTPCEYEVIHRLMENAQRVNITACTDRISDERVIIGELFYPVIRTCEKIMVLAKEKNLPFEKPLKLADSSRGFASKELVHLEQNLFSAASKVYEEPVRNIRLNIYENIYEEIRETASLITRLVRDSGYKYGDISVVCSDMENYESYIRSIFTQYRIPYFIDMKKPIDDNPLIVFVRTLFSIHIYRYRSEDIFSLLKTGLTDISMEEIDMLENYVLKFGIQGSWWNEEIEWNFIKEQGNSVVLFNEDDINIIKNAVIEEIRAFFNGLPTRSDPKTFFFRLYGFLDQYGVLRNYKKMTAKFKEEGNLENANRFISAYNAFMNLLDTATDVLKDRKYTVLRYRDFIESGITGYESGSVPPALEQVNVGNVQRSMNRKVKAVFILGANEGKFPGINLDEGILSDGDRSLLEKHRIELAPDTLSRTFETKYILYKTLCLPSEKLFISCSSMDMKGANLRPAYVFTVIKRLFSALSMEGNVSKKDKSFEECIGTPESTFKEWIRAMADKERLQKEPGWYAVRKWFEEKEDWAERVRLLYKAYNMTYIDKSMDARLAEELFGCPLIGSVSAFESYVTCPFSFFLEYGIRAKEREVSKITPLGIGSVAHTVLEMFFRHIQEIRPDYRDISDDYLNRCIAEEMKRAAAIVWGKNVLSSKRNEYLLDRYGNTLSLTAKTLLGHITGGDFRPVRQEMTFGGKRGLKPVEIIGEHSKGILSGKIDRLDMYKQDDTAYIRIIDYKTGTKDFSLEDFYYGLQMQLPVYLKALLENQDYFKLVFGIRQVIPAGILYYNIDDPVVKTRYGADPSEIEQLVAKQLMLKGLVLDQEPVIKAMDRSFSDRSIIINVKRNKDGSFSKNSDTASLEEFKIMEEYTEYLLKNIVNDIGKGDIRRYPVLKGDYKGCQYCLYKGLCGFDPDLRGCRYNFLPKLEKNEILRRISEKLNKERNDGDKVDS